MSYPLDFGSSYNRVVLVGNGFDLALGLPTSYSEFIFDCFKQSLISFFSGTPAHDIGLFDFPDKRVNVSGSTQEIVKELEELNSIEELQNYRGGGIFSRMEHRFWFFRELATHYTSGNWVDVENFYFSELMRLHEESRLGARLEKRKKAWEDLLDLNLCMDAMTNELEAYLLRQTAPLKQRDIEAKTIRVIPNLSKPMQPNDFKRAWDWTRIRPEDEPKGPRRILFLNFNYTNTLELALQGHTDMKYRIVNIHGSASDASNPPIFGYGDDTGDRYSMLERDGRNEVIRKIKSFQYPKTGNYHQFLGFIDSAPYEVFILGHSCGLSDKTMLKTLFEHPKCAAIKNYHYKGLDEDFDKWMTISRIFEDKERMRRLILPHDEKARLIFS